MDEETSDESNAAFSDAAHSAETLQCEDEILILLGDLFDRGPEFWR